MQCKLNRYYLFWCDPRQILEGLRLISGTLNALNTPPPDLRVCPPPAPASPGRITRINMTRVLNVRTWSE